MDKEIIFYIIFGLIYLLSRVGRKKRKKSIPQSPQQPQSQPQNRPVQSQPQPQAQPQPQPQPSRTVQSEKEEAPMSFEDILRELSGEGRKKREEAQSVPAPPVPQARKPLVSQPKPEPASEPSYKGSVSEKNTEAADLWTAYKDDKQEQLTTHTSFKEEDREDRSLKFDVYDQKAQENPLTSEIREMLKDKEDVKKAVVLAEILNRKY